MKRRILSVIAISMFLITLLSGCNNDIARLEVLKVMNWADYIDESLLPEFEKYYKDKTGKNIRVIYQTVDNPQIMATKIETGKEDWDLACPSESIAERMLASGSLLPIDLDKKDGEGNYVMKNYHDFVSPYMKKAFADMEKSVSPDPSKRYSVGYMWGTFGILYNKDKADTKDLTGWDVMWNPKYKGSVLMKNAVREIFPVTLTYVYRQQLLDTLKKSGYEAYKNLLNEIYDLNINTAEKISKVEQALKDQKRIVSTLYETDDGKDGMVNGLYALDQAWSGDAVWSMLEAANTGVTLDFFIPEEGSNIWYDAWVIPKYAQNKEAAELFIDFLCRPDNATINMDFIGYTSTTKSPDVIEWSFKNELIDTAISENTELKELYNSEDDAFYGKYNDWYDNWYDENYSDWYNSGEGLDLRYFYNDEGITGVQSFTSSTGKLYYTDKVMANHIQYPPESDIDKCAVMKGFASNVIELNNMWIRVKGQTLPLYVSVMMIIMTVIAAGFLAWYIIHKRAEKKKLSKLLVRRHLHNHSQRQTL